MCFILPIHKSASMCIMWENFSAAVSLSIEGFFLIQNPVGSIVTVLYFLVSPQFYKQISFLRKDWTQNLVIGSMRVCMPSYFSHVQLFATLWTVACQDQSGFPCPPPPPPGDLPDPGMEPASLMSPELAGEFFAPSVTWKALWGFRLYPIG